MIKVLILSCGTNAGIHIARVLKEKFSKDFLLTGCDINKPWLVGSAEWLDDFVQCPLSIDENYYDFILKLCKTNKIDWIVPVYDTDQFLFTSNNPDLQKLNVKSFGLPVPLEFYRDKISAADFLCSCGIPVPRNYKLSELLDENEYFIKPVHGSGSIGAGKAFGKEIKRIPNADEYLIQKLCKEPEYTLECFCYNNTIYSICRERIASKSGVCIKTRIFYNEELNSYAEKLLQKTELPIIFNMQFMQDEDGKFLCTDLNLRAAGGMALSYAAGWDIISSIANIMLGKDESEVLKTIKKEIPEQYVVRHYEETVTKKISKKIAFDFDGTLLDSRERHQIAMKKVLSDNELFLDTSGLVQFKSNGKTNKDWLRANGLSEQLVQKINSEWINIIESEEYLKHDVLYDGVSEYLRTISKDNEIYLITARKNETGLFKQITELGIGAFFSKVIVVSPIDNVIAKKADAISKLQIDCFIGDTESDFKAAQTAGCRFYAVTYGFRSFDFLNKLSTNTVDDIKKIPLD